MKEYCVVSGCAGTIGTNLCEKLLENYNVIGLDNLSMDAEKGLKNIKYLEQSENFIFKYRNVSMLHSGLLPDQYFEAFLKENDIKTFFHLAANSDISNSNFQTEYNNTFQTTIEVLKFCTHYNIKEIVFTSSGSVYGEAYITETCYNENYGPLIPISHYGAAKLASEKFIETFSKEYGIRSFICRLPNVVGTPATHGVILDFINKLKKNLLELEVLGDGNQIKPYMHVKDVVDAMIFIWTFAKNDINIYNITPTGRTKVSEIARMVIKEMDADPVIKYTGGDRGWPSDVPESAMDGLKLRMLGFTPNLTSNEAVIKAIKEILQS